MTEAQNDRSKESLIDRRIKFLIREAQLKDPIRDQTITYAFRVVTNHFSRCPYDIKSSLLREKCPYRSKKAHNLFRLLKAGEGLKAREEWLDRVTNEHQYPIKDAWEWMKKERANLSVRRVRDRLKKWPVVVVTKDENERLREVDKESRKVVPAIRPDQRYLKAKIKVLKETKPGEWRLR